MVSPRDTRERIVSAARQLFAGKGFDGATTAAIARRAEVAEGTIYRHFRDKKELFVACVAPALGESLDQGISQLKDRKGLRDLVQAMLAHRLQLIQEHMDSFNILFTEAPYHPELTELFLDQVIRSRAEQIGPLIHRLLDTGELKRSPSPLILGLGLTVAMWALLNFRERAKSLEAVVPRVDHGQSLLDELTEFVLYGVAGQPGGEG